MTGLLRPTFSEGQILGASDLNAHVTYERLGAVLHERTEHLWGVCAGLELVAAPRTTSAGARHVEVQLMPGRAVDRLGRVIVLTVARTVEPDQFADQIATPAAGDLYPVYVQAIEQPRPGTARPGVCATAHATQIEEGFQISFGTPGSEIAILEHEAAPVADGFGTPAPSDKVVVGWVRWDPSLRQFASVEALAGGRGIRHGGVVASEVIAPGGKLGLRTRRSGPRFALTLTETSTGGCELRFGKQDGTSAVSPAFTVDENGNVSFQGTLSGVTPAHTVAESGVAFDGIQLPLPEGVSQDQVAQGKRRIHVLVSPVPVAPRMVAIDGTTPELAIPVVVGCLVDEDRRVRCRIRWFAAGAFDKSVELPGACTYVLVASGK